MRNPFTIDGPTAISVSGGRTSGFMLHLILEANGGSLPECAVAMFANTGLEDEATLRFVRDMGERWSVPIRWVEYRTEAPGFALVDFDSASRNGEPFEAIIRKRNYLPNPVTRFCTSELKIRAMHKHLRTLGWLDAVDGEIEGWDQMIGIRADEQRRVAKIRARGHSTESRHEHMTLPLADAGVVLQDVDAFWRAQPFQLELSTNAAGRTTGGNCVLCYLKPAAQVLSLIAEDPKRAVWWARMEAEGVAMATGGGARFRNDRPSYAQLLAYATQQTDLFDAAEEGAACFCGD